MGVNSLLNCTVSEVEKVWWVVWTSEVEFLLVSAVFEVEMVARLLDKEMKTK